MLKDKKNLPRLKNANSDFLIQQATLGKSAEKV